MESLKVSLHDNMGLLLLLGAAALFYVACRAALDATGRRGLAQWMPIAIVAGLATLLDHPEVAMGVIFGTSVASLSLVLGISATLSPKGASDLSRSGHWALVLPAALLVLLAGFGAGLSVWHASVLLTQGAVVAAAWREAASNPDLPPVARRASSVRLAEIALAVALAVLAGWAALQGAQQISRRVQLLSPGLIAATLMAPALAFPMVGVAAVVAQRGALRTTAGTCVGIVLFNLCALLPAVIGLWYLRQFLMGTPYQDLRPLIFPLAVWRIDTVVLIALGCMLIPVSMGRITLRWIGGLVLILAYAAYLAAVTAVGIRRL